MANLVGLELCAIYIYVHREADLYLLVKISIKNKI
jgi:hypothetical protein